MGPGKGGEPSGDLAAAIEQAFGDFDSFKQQLTDVFGQSFRLGLGLARVQRRDA